jgi:FkbM family methyltransferase
MYFAKAGNGKVVAFEPNVLNLLPLVQNINANNLQDKIVLAPMPLTDQNTISNFLLSDFELGSAMSAFGSDYGWDGNKLKSIASYQTTGVSIDNLLRLFPELGKPNLIKLDVDGIESLILQGGMSTLSGPSVRSILVEVNPQLDPNKILIEEILGGLGFSRRQVLQGGGNNQIWDRNTLQTKLKDN